tara:strand:+ start:263 stop:664 length:402 start_codon:yes stop_codon:yes gene_type:complete
MIELDFVLYFLVFIVGMLFHKISSDILGMSHLSIFIKIIEIQSLKMLQIVASDVEYIQETKLKLLRDLNTPEEEIKFIRSVDEQTFKTWKEAVILHFIASYPDRYKRQIEFSDWRGAMKQLNYVEKKSKTHFN